MVRRQHHHPAAVHHAGDDHVRLQRRSLAAHAEEDRPTTSEERVVDKVALLPPSAHSGVEVVQALREPASNVGDIVVVAFDVAVDVVVVVVAVAVVTEQRGLGGEGRRPQAGCCA